MWKRSLLILACSWISARADSIPTILITSAGGEIYTAAGGVDADLGGPGFSLNFGVFPTSGGTNSLAYTGLPFGSVEAMLSGFMGATLVTPFGSLTLDGATYAVDYTSGIVVQSPASFITPAAPATLAFPAVLGGGAQACPVSTSSSVACFSTSPIATVDFDVPALAIISFMPYMGGAYPPAVAFTETFIIGVPELSTMALTLSGLAMTTIAIRYRRY